MEQLPRQATSSSLEGLETLARDSEERLGMRSVGHLLHSSATARALEIIQASALRIPVLPKNPKDTPKKICFAIVLAEPGWARLQFSASCELPCFDQYIIEKTAITVIVSIWKAIIERATLLDSRIPNKQIQENRTSMMIVSSWLGNGNDISPARYEPALAAETTA